MTLLELMIAMTVMLMVVGTLGGLAHSVQMSFEYSEGYGIATQHARVALDRIAQNVCQATANEKFPGCLVVAEQVGSYTYPDMLVIWRPGGNGAAPNAAPPHADGLPRYNELLVYCPNPVDSSNAELLEIKPTNTGTAPLLDPNNMAASMAAWQAAIPVLKTGDATVLTTLVRVCRTSVESATLRGAARFETRLRPSLDDWKNYTDYTDGSTPAWKDLPWVQGLFGPNFGLRQVWVRMELQMTPGVDWIASNPAGAQAVPFFGSAALYYNLAHP